MEPTQPGNKKITDFNSLNDRLIAESPAGPMIVIKTNLDSKDSTANNPYYHEKEIKDPKRFRDYFEE